MKRAWLEIDFAKLKNNYEITKTFSHAEIYDQLNKYLPSDMTYLQPTITIYKIKNSYICKDYMPKIGPSGGDNLEKEKPEREYFHMANMLLLVNLCFQKCN